MRKRTENSKKIMISSIFKKLKINFIKYSSLRMTTNYR